MRDKCQLPEFWWCHWWLVTRHLGIWKRSCSNPSAMGYLCPPYSQYGKAVTVYTIQLSAFSEHIIGNFCAKSQDKRLLPTQLMTRVIIQLERPD